MAMSFATLLTRALDAAGISETGPVARWLDVNGRDVGRLMACQVTYFHAYFMVTMPMICPQIAAINTVLMAQEEVNRGVKSVAGIEATAEELLTGKKGLSGRTLTVFRPVDRKEVD